MSKQNQFDGRNGNGYQPLPVDGAESAQPPGYLSMNESSVYIYAARYAHHRNTGAAMQVVNAILNKWEHIDGVTQVQLQKEAEEATFNLIYWKKLIDR